MKIRNTKQFVSEILGNNNSIVNPLSDKSELFEKQFGSNISLKGHVERIANFADNANQQLIFELLQNADDANNDKNGKGLFQVHFNEKYFMVINNGRPFFTNQGNEKGSLERFMSWDILEDSNNFTGKFGKGSKLLYNLFIDETNTIKNDYQKRVDSIINKHNGPIIFSWSKLSSLENIKAFNKNDNFDPQECNNNEYPLLTKLINTYYPAQPNEENINGNKRIVNLFPNSEIEELSNYLKTNLKPEPNYLWDRGTLIFIKLGKGQADKFKFDYEGGIRTYLSFSKNIHFVKINNNPPIKKENIICTKQLSINEKKYEIAFPDSDKLMKRINFVNFHNVLPVLKERHGFKFIINTDAFNIQENRQNIDFSTNYNKGRLDDVVNIIKSFLTNPEIDFTKGIKLYKSILLSEEEKIHKPELKEFHQKLIKIIRNIIPSNSQFVSDIEQVKINTTKLDINLNDLGIGQFSWLDKELMPFYNEAKEILGIEEKDIKDIIVLAKNDNLISWIKELSNNEYNRFIEEIGKLSSLENLKDISIIRASNNEIYSINDFIKSDNKILLSTRTSEFNKILNTDFHR